MWNRFCFWIACYFLAKVNVVEADNNAHWDDAQNSMEAITCGNIKKMDEFSKILGILHRRAEERSDDLIVEQGHNLVNILKENNLNFHFKRD